MLSIALLIGRLLVAPHDPAPEVTDRAVLFIKRHQLVDPCATPDAGTEDGGAGDGGTPDAGPGDAGTPDAGLDDAGVPDAAVCALQPLDTITMIVQPELGLPYENTSFALLYVTPARPQVTAQASSIFHGLALSTAPTIETETVYVEDRAYGTQCNSSAGCGGGAQHQQSSGGCGSYESSSWAPPSIVDSGVDDGEIDIETVGPYEIVRVQPATSSQLTDWLDQLGYTYEQADVDAITPYINAGYHVVAVRAKISSQIARRMAPLAFTWEGDEIRLPVALGQTSQMSNTPLTVYIAADGRYELPGATIDFAMYTSDDDDGTGFLTRNDVVLDTSQPASADPIAIANGSGQYRATKIVTVEKHVPVSVYCDDGHEGFGCSDCSSGTRRRQIDFGTIAFAALIALRRRRRQRAPRS